MSNFVQQPDGTYIPSAETLARVRANPQKYPDAAKDFARMSGKPEDLVQAMLDNPGSSGFWGTAGGIAVDIGQGAMNAGAIAAENLLPESILGDGAGLVRDYAERLDPKFETDKSMGEVIAEGAGQALPAVAATIGTGGWAGVAIGAGVGSLTFADEDNFANALNEIAPGITPDILVVQPDDDEFASTAKALVSNIVTDALFLGTADIAGKAIKALARGAPIEEIKAIAKEADGAISDRAMPLAEITDVTRSAANRHVSQQLDLFEKTGSVQAPMVADPVHRKAFMDEVFTSFNLLGKRTENVAGGLAKFNEARRSELTLYADKVYSAIQRSDRPGLVALLQKGVQANDAVEAAYINPFQNSVLKATLGQVDAKVDDAIKRIRAEPEITTRAAFKATLEDAAAYKLEIGELYRLYGSSPAYQMLDRKGDLKDWGVDAVIEAEKFVKDTAKDLGFDLFSDRISYITAQAKTLDEIGIDVTKVMPELEEMFAKFDVERQGVLANLRQNATVKMSPEQRAAATASFIRMVKDVQSAALLGQLSTTGLEVISNTVNNLLLPVIEHGLAKGNLKRAGAEYAGYAAAFKTARGIAAKSFKQGKGILDDFDLTEGAHSGILDYVNLADKPVRRLMLRLFKFATDLSLASSEFWKATRAYGLAYADGLELAMKAGQGRVAAKRYAREFAAKQFDETGALLNVQYRNDVAKTSWQQAFDTRYVTGKLGQSIDNVRNRDDVTGLLARSAIPFFRTLINIGSDATQYIVPPGLPMALRRMSKSGSGKWLNRVPKTLKALDDFTGANGAAAEARAIGRHRLGMGMVASALGAVATSDNVEITGASGGKRWDARKRAFEEYPPNSIIIGDTAVDLNRLLPFSAPLMLAGAIRDMEIENELQMKDANYAPDSGAVDWLVNAGQALVFTNLTLFQDSAAAQGVFDLATAFDEALQNENAGPLIRYGQKYASQFTPGPVKMAAKNYVLDQYEGYDFFSAFAASAGFPVGYKRLDFLGEPIVHGLGRGVDPLNMRQLHKDGPIHLEFIYLNKTGGLAIVPPRPEAVFDKSFWKSMGVDVGGALSFGQMPTLTDLKTVDGKDGWEEYRGYLYRGRVSQDVQVSTSGSGDRVGVGKVLIQQGENFADAMKRLVEQPSYRDLMPDARIKVWNAVFNYFKERAKGILGGTIVVHPEVFEGSRYGSPLTAPASINATAKAGHALGAQTQRTKGSPRDLDAIFAIQR